MASAVVAILVCCVTPAGASAQSSSGPLASASSSGLTAEVVGVAYNDYHLSVQIVIKNTSNVRIYLEDTTEDDSQRGFLGSGENLLAPMINGLPSCGNNYSECSSDTEATEIDKFSYVDPGSTLGVAMIYTDLQAPPSPDTISFSLTMMARFAKSDDDSSPDDAGPVQEITLAFPFLSFH
jgi:hypothetical protein